MATIKKASVKAIEFCQQLTTRPLGKSTTWEQCYEIVADEACLTMDVYTHCTKTGDNTVVTLYKVVQDTEDEELNVWSIPNSEVFDGSVGDWDWFYIYKAVVEWYIKNAKKLNKGTKKKPSKKKVVDVSTLMKEVSELKTAIKEATDSAKKKLIVEYNEKSIILQEHIERTEAAAKAQQEANKASAEDLKKLKNKKANTMQRIKKFEAVGKDTTELKKELKQIVHELEVAKTGIKK